MAVEESNVFWVLSIQRTLVYRASEYVRGLKHKMRSPVHGQICMVREHLSSKG